MEQQLTETPATPRHRSRRTLAALAVSALVVMTVGASAALASSPTPAAQPTGATPNASSDAVDATAADAAFKAYASCMRDHGIDLPDPVTVSSSATSVSGVGPLVIVPADGTASGPLTVVSGPVVTAPEGGTATTGSGVIVTSGTAQAIGTPIDDAAFKAADAACSPILEKAGIHSAGTIGTGGVDITGPVTSSTSGSISGAPGGAGTLVIGVAGSGDTAKIAADMTSYAACMRSHGVDMPDPVADGASGSVRLQFAGDPTTTTFRAADTACASGAFPGIVAPPAPVATAAP